MNNTIANIKIVKRFNTFFLERILQRIVLDKRNLHSDYSYYIGSICDSIELFSSFYRINSLVELVKIDVGKIKRLPNVF